MINQIRDLVASGVYVEVLAVNPILDNGIKEREIFDKSSSQRVFSILSKEQSTRPLLTSILGLLFCCLSFKRFNLIKLFLHFFRGQIFFVRVESYCGMWGGYTVLLGSLNNTFPRLTGSAAAGSAIHPGAVSGILRARICKEWDCPERFWTVSDRYRAS